MAEPADLDTLLEELSHSPKGSSSQDGEFLYVRERLIVSPANGMFTPATDVGPGAELAVGDILGHVGTVEVRTPFAGELHGMLALQGERVVSSQPIAWLRVTT